MGSILLQSQPGLGEAVPPCLGDNTDIFSLTSAQTGRIRANQQPSWLRPHTNLSQELVQSPSGLPSSHREGKDAGPWCI